MRFEFATATRIIFGPGTAQQIGSLAAELGERAFVVTGRTKERTEPLLRQLQKHGIAYSTFSVEHEPAITTLTQCLAQARRAECDLVIGIGGGSVIDTGKAVAIMLSNPGRPEDYLEVVGPGKRLTKTPIPYIALPTTAGTGAEVTRNCVLAVPEHRVKVSLRSPLMLPRIAVVDPELTYSMPPEVTASTGLDALTQLIEPYVSNKANALTDGICIEGLKRIGRSLQKAHDNGDNRAAREDMALASLFGGLALANAALGAVHGLAGPLGGMVGVGHGAICARLLPHVMRANVSSLQKRQPDSPALPRYDEIARILTGRGSARAQDGVEWVSQLCKALNLPPLSEFGLTKEELPALIEKAKNASSMKGNPIALRDDELTKILSECCLR